MESTFISPPAYSFFVPGKPVPQGAITSFPYRKGPSLGVRTIHKNQDVLYPWRDRVKLIASEIGPEVPFKDSIIITYHFYVHAPKSEVKTFRTWPIRRPDLSHLIRAIEDALSGVIYKDDSQIVDSHEKVDWCEPQDKRIPTHKEGVQVDIVVQGRYRVEKDYRRF